MGDSELPRIGTPPGGNPQRPKRYLVPVLVACLGVAVAAGGTAIYLLSQPSSATPSGVVTSAQMRIVEGTLAVPALMVVVTNRMTTGDACEVGDNHRDSLRIGTQITVVDRAGATIALAKLDQGEVNEGHCVMPFRVKIPLGHGIYGFSIASHGTAQFNESDLVRPVRMGVGKDGNIRTG